MCGCDESGHVCSRCAGTPDDPGYLFEPDPRDDEAQAREAFSEGRSAYEPLPFGMVTR